jgi:hypothetical protein
MMRVVTDQLLRFSTNKARAEPSFASRIFYAALGSSASAGIATVSVKIIFTPLECTGQNTLLAFVLA